jgi:hypothetical protein
MRPAARSSLVLVLLLALGASGCFGSGNGGTTQAGPSFHDQALAVCRATQRQVVALGTPSTVTSLPQLAVHGATVLRLQRHEIAQLHALTPPASDAAAVQAALRSMAAATAAGARLVSYARANDPAAVTAQQQVVTAAVAAANRALLPLGLTTCER